nr:hypothetical protein [Tanacetum cinerariifolium]
MQGSNQPKGSDHIMQSVDINTKSYAGVAGASAKEQPKVSYNFRPLVADLVFDDVNISHPRKVFKKAKHGLKRIMMYSKGLFFFKFDSWDGLEAVLEGRPWLICKSLIILKKWSMDTRLLKEELTRILIWVKLHDVPIQVFEEDEAHLVDVVIIGIPSLTRDDFTKETIRVGYEWRPPRCNTCKIFGHIHENLPKKVATPPIVATSNVVTPTVKKTNDGFQTVGKKKKKGKSKSNNDGQFVGPSVKQNVATPPIVATSNVVTPTVKKTNDGFQTVGKRNKKKGKSKSNNDEEQVENVYDETTYLFPKTKTSGSSYFMTGVG